MKRFNSLFGVILYEKKMMNLLFYLLGLSFVVCHSFVLGVSGLAFSGSDALNYHISSLEDNLFDLSFKYKFYFLYNVIIGSIFYDDFLKGIVIRLVNFTLFYSVLLSVVYNSKMKVGDRAIFFISVFFIGCSLSIYNLRDVFVLIGFLLIVNKFSGFSLLFGLLLVLFNRTEVFWIMLLILPISYFLMSLLKRFEFRFFFLVLFSCCILTVKLVDFIPITPEVKRAIAYRLLVVSENDENSYNLSGSEAAQLIDSGASVSSMIYSNLLPRIPSAIYRANPVRLLPQEIGVVPNYKSVLVLSPASVVLNFFSRSVYTFLFIPILLLILYDSRVVLDNVHNRKMLAFIILSVLMLIIYFIRFGEIQDRNILPVIVPVIYYFFVGGGGRRYKKQLKICMSIMLFLTFFYFLTLYSTL